MKMCALALQQCCRLLPWTVRNYKLDEVSSVGELRRNVGLLFRQHAHITDPRVCASSLPLQQAWVLHETDLTASAKRIFLRIVLTAGVWSLSPSP